MDEMREYIIKVNVNGKLANECLNVLQAKELVRCNDCRKGARLERTGMTPMVTCKGEDHELDWFCADGEKRTD